MINYTNFFKFVASIVTTSFFGLTFLAQSLYAIDSDTQINADYTSVAISPEPILTEATQESDEKEQESDETEQESDDIERESDDTKQDLGNLSDPYHAD